MAKKKKKKSLIKKIKNIVIRSKSKKTETKKKAKKKVNKKRQKKTSQKPIKKAKKKTKKIISKTFQKKQTKKTKKIVFKRKKNKDTTQQTRKKPQKKAEKAVVQSMKKEKRLTYIDEMKKALLNYKDHPPEQTILVDAERRAYCLAIDCDQIAQVESYCRYHYLSLWKKIQKRRKILAENQIYTYLQILSDSYSLRMIYVIYKDLSDERDFLDVIQELYSDDLEFSQSEEGPLGSNIESEIENFNKG